MKKTTLTIDPSLKDGFKICTRAFDNLLGFYSNIVSFYTVFSVDGYDSLTSHKHLHKILQYLEGLKVKVDFLPDPLLVRLIEFVISKQTIGDTSELTLEARFFNRPRGVMIKKLVFAFSFKSGKLLSLSSESSKGSCKAVL